MGKWTFGHLAFPFGEPCPAWPDLCGLLLDVLEWAWVAMAWDAIFEVGANFLLCAGAVCGLGIGVLLLAWKLWSL